MSCQIILTSNHCRIGICWLYFPFKFGQISWFFTCLVILNYIVYNFIFMRLQNSVKILQIMFCFGGKLVIFLGNNSLVRFKLLNIVGKCLFGFQSICYVVWIYPLHILLRLVWSLGSGLCTCSIYKIFDSLLWLCFQCVQFRGEPETCIYWFIYTEVNDSSLLCPHQDFPYVLWLQGTLFPVLLDRNMKFFQMKSSWTAT